MIRLDPPYPWAEARPGDGLVNGDGARYPVGEDLLDEPLALVLCDLRQPPDGPPPHHPPSASFVDGFLSTFDWPFSK